MNEVWQFIGRSHLLLVHIPIGMMFLALIFQRMGRKPKNAVFRTVVPTTLLISSSIAILASITGFILARHGDYDRTTLQWHQWLGLVVSALGIVAWRFSGHSPGTWQVNVWRNFIAVALFILLLLTGYLGSTLTHGQGYLIGKVRTELRSWTEDGPASPEQ